MPSWNARWVASPPPGAGPPPQVRTPDVRYSGPPRYGPTHPAWGFPPVALASGPTPPQREAERMAKEADRRRTARSVSAAVAVALATSVTSLIAAVAEGWRFALMLRGRTEVLDPGVVRANAAVVTTAGVAAAVLGVIALATTTAALANLTANAAAAQGLRPARGMNSIVARMLVPGWNLVGAGQVVTEAIRAVFHQADAAQRRRMRRVAVATWCAWFVGGTLAAVTIVVTGLRMTSARWSASDQWTANIVELHVALDAVAAVTALLAAVTLAMLRTEWRGGRLPRRAGWVVAPPPSTPRNRADDQPMREVTPVSTGVDSSASTTSAT